MFKGVEVVCFLAAYVVAFGLEAIKLRWKESKLASTGSFVFLLLGLFAVFSLYHGITSIGVDNAAHIGGLLIGIVLAKAMYKK